MGHRTNPEARAATTAPPRPLRGRRLRASALAPRRRDSCALPRKWMPDVEEVEPLRGMLAHDVLQQLNPRTCCRLFLAALAEHRGGDADVVAVVVSEQAERGHDRYAGRAREQERPERKRRRAAEERNTHVTARADRAIALERDDLAPTERGDQLHADAGVRSRY